MLAHGLAIGWPDRDRFSPNAPADVLVISPDVDWLEGDVDPLSKLVFSWDDRWLKTTVVAGSVAYQQVSST